MALIEWKIVIWDMWFYLFQLSDHCNRLCYLVVRVSGYRSRDPGFDSQHYQIFWEVMGLKRGSLSLVSTIGELLGRKSSGSGLENRKYGCKDPLCWKWNTLHHQKLALTLPTSGGRSVSIVCSWTKITEFVCLFCLFVCLITSYKTSSTNSIENSFQQSSQL
jgi:hypothetical protein